ncbi:MAG: hypothetical protein Q8M33_06850 [Hydrogenophaga sp.]|nr:hypothetical protein [Hydrogenophaga sp.]MDZ4161268.1 hypothetical protein [Burkholderiales bacterium]
MTIFLLLDSHHPRQQAAFGQYPKAPILVGGEQVGINVLFIIETCAKLSYTRPEVVAFMHGLADAERLLSAWLVAGDFL